jgi:hypothetical protein
MMKGCVFLHVAGFVLRSSLRNRPTLLLTCAIVCLMLLSVGTRLPITGQGAGAFDRIHALVENPSLERIAAWGASFFALTPVPRGAVAGTVLFSNEGTRHDVSTICLSGVLLFALPLVAVLVGVGTAPPRGGTTLTICSAPIRRATLHLAYTTALLGYLVGVLAIGWGLCALLLHAAGLGGQTQRQLVSVFAYSALLASICASLGLWLGVWFKRPSAAMLAGITCIIVLVGIFPNLGEFLTESYFDTRPELVQPVRDTGVWPSDPAFLAILAARHTPANALMRIFREIANPTPTTLDRTCNCRVAWSSAKVITEETIALAAALVIAVLGGLLVFARQEVSES